MSTRPAGSFRCRRVSLQNKRPSLWNSGPIELVPGNERDAFTQRFRLRHPQAKNARPARASDRRLLSLEIHVTRSERELMLEATRAIRLHRDRLSRSEPPSVEPRTRRRLDQYSLYLRVWDLRQARRTFPQIAQEIYPERISPLSGTTKSDRATSRRSFPAREDSHSRRLQRIKVTVRYLLFHAAVREACCPVCIRRIYSAMMPPRASGVRSETQIPGSRLTTPVRG